MMMSFGAMGVAGVAWAVAGYSLAFAGGTAWIGGIDHLFLHDVAFDDRSGVPHLLFMAFQGTFAIITAALISGAIVERVRFGAFLSFLGGWILLVYAPVCHWVWGGGWLARLDALDFAGGTVVHVNAGAAAVAAAAFLGPRVERGRRVLLPHNVPFVLLGAGLLWFGWLGFNGGSALAADRSAVLAFVNTMLAPAAAILVWLALDRRHTGKVTAVGCATGIVVGLVAVTPAAGFVGPTSAMLLGAIAVVPSYYAVVALRRTRLDDTLDVAAAHGVGGIVGALLTGVLAEARWGGADGLLAGNPSQLGVQALGVAAVAVYSGAASYALLWTLSRFLRVRVHGDEAVGMDVLEHGEEAYGTGEGAALGFDPRQTAGESA
jgi:Amt family ammonium transporter